MERTAERFPDFNQGKQGWKMGLVLWGCLQPGRLRFPTDDGDVAVLVGPTLG